MALLCSALFYLGKGARTEQRRLAETVRANNNKAQMGATCAPYYCTHSLQWSPMIGADLRRLEMVAIVSSASSFGARLPLLRTH